MAEEPPHIKQLSLNHVCKIRLMLYYINLTLSLTAIGPFGHTPLFLKCKILNAEGKVLLKNLLFLKLMFWLF